MSKRDAQKARSSYHSSEHAAMLEYTEMEPFFVAGDSDAP